MKRLVAILLALTLTLSLCACGKTAPVEEPQPEATQVFTDSVGRQVEVPVQIDRVAVSGPLAQIVLFALCPDKLVGVATEWSTQAQEYLDEKYLGLPLIGQLYGGKGELNPETLLQSGAQVVIDVGETKGSVKEDMDALQQQTGIPYVHISATLDTMPEVYEQLGELLGMQQEAAEMSAYCEEVYSRAMSVAETVEKANVLYITGENGLHVIAQSSYHAAVIDTLANNLAQVSEPSSKGTGNEVDMEQILAWNPEVILFAPESIYDTVGSDPLWQSVSAIQNGRYYEVPEGPYNWMGFPPSVQRLLGMMWMETLLYPDAVDYDLRTEVQEYYRLFYHCTLTDAQFDALMEHSAGKLD